MIYHEGEMPPVENVAFLGLHGRSTLGCARERLRKACEAASPEVAVWHGMWAMDHLAGMDQAARRILVQHGDVPALERLLSRVGALLDGVLCVSPTLVPVVLRSVPALTADRVLAVPYPISPSVQDSPRRKGAGKPFVIGYCGRLIVEQKRVDRFPGLCDALDQTGLEYQFEILGDGPERVALDRRSPSNRRVVSHGRLEGASYWRVLRGWDAIIFTSDYEGTPIALLEALSAGVVPVYPRIASGGDALVAGIADGLLYEPGRMDQAAATLARLATLPEPEFAELRGRCVRAAEPHTGDDYLRLFGAFVRHIADAKRVSSAGTRRLPAVFDACSFDTLEWLGDVRRGIARLFR